MDPYGVSLDGVGDYIESRNNIGITGSANRSVSIWLKTSIDNAEWAWGWGEATAYKGFALEFDTGDKIQLEFYLGNLEYSFNYDDGEWHHYLAVLDGTTINDGKLYIDGDLQTPSAKTNETETVITTDGHVFVGCKYYNQAGEYNGHADQLAVYNAALSASDVRKIYNSGVGSHIIPTANLVLLWQMNEGTGTTVDDMGDNNIGDFNGDPQWVIGHVPTGTGGWSIVRPQIKTLLETISDIHEVSDTPKLKFNGYPACYVVPSENTADYETQTENVRVYAFIIRAFYETKKIGMAEAMDRLDGVVDSIIDAFDKDDQKGSDERTVAVGLPAGSTFLNIFAAPSRWGQLEAEGLIMAEITVKIRVSRDVT